jgi:hypothetical protein
MSSSQQRWFPGGREERFALVKQTNVFMSIEDNRITVGFGPNTPYGMWYDQSFTPIQSYYFSKYQIWLNPATSTRAALENLKLAEKNFFPLYREFYAFMKASPLVSNASLVAMGFPPRPDGGRSPHPVDKLFIVVHVRPLANFILEVSFSNRDTGSSMIPYFLTGAVCFYSVSDKPITNPNELTHSKLATRSHIDLVFDPLQRGKMVYIAARWQNRRGEVGPWSEIVAVVIP